MIDAIQTIVLIFLLLGLIYTIWQLAKRFSLEDTFFQTVEDAITEAKKDIKRESWIELDKYITAIRNEYDVIYKKIDEQKEKIAELTKLLNNQTEAIKQHYAAQNKEIERLRKELHKTQSMLSRCKKRMQRMKNGNETS